ncbi:MAG: response regulator, partial [Nitrospiraceae bacterium]|nr:response regulator [Nitrospiraceae bacterium]
VKDTGAGIAEDRLPTLFAPFVQADGSITRKYGGTGLGLSISKHLTEMMGGEIGAESEEGKGSTFWFTAVFPKLDELQLPEISEEQALTNLVDCGRILIIDDNETNRLVLKRQLGAWRLRYEEAEDGEAGWDKLVQALEEGEPFAMAIIDMQMPKIDGETLGRRIKADRRLAGTILVMMTSVGHRGDATRLKEAGFAAYLTKPVKQSQLHDCLAIVSGANRPKPEDSQPQPLVTKHLLAERKRASVRILLAEDNVTNQLVAISILKKHGYHADAVANGAEAVKALEAVPYDLVLMDIQMPEMDGFEATRRVRAADSTALDPRVPIIAMTAHAMKGDRELCLESGMDDYVSKPIDSNDLIGAIERQLSRYGEEGEPRSAPSLRIPEERQVFNEDDLKEKVGDDPELLQLILNTFVDDAQTQMAAIEEALQGRDAPALASRAHALKSAAGNASAERFYEACLALELAGKEEQLDEAHNVYEVVKREFEEFARTVD